MWIDIFYHGDITNHLYARFFQMSAHEWGWCLTFSQGRPLHSSSCNSSLTTLGELKKIGSYKIKNYILQSLFDRKRFLFNQLLDHTLAKLQLKVCKKRLFQIIKIWYGKFTLISNFTYIYYLSIAEGRRFFFNNLYT